MQILVIEEGLYTIIAGIYTFIARIYDIMLKLVQSGSEAGSITDFYISDIATVMYTIAGVFMLFRVTIAMINMLINPDAINDGKAGAGKLITRIVTSILLLIVFVPNGFIFGDAGILTRLEGALLAEDGLINNIMPNSKTSQVKGTTMNVEKSTKTLIDNVYAVPTNDTGNTNTQRDCYYVNIDKNYTEGSKAADAAGGATLHISDIYHIRFYNNSTNGTHKICHKNVVISEDSTNTEEECPYSYDFITDNNNFASELSPSKQIAIFEDGGIYSQNNAFQNGQFLTSCPKDVHRFSIADTFGRYGLKYKYFSGDNKHWYNAGTGIFGGWTSEDTLKVSLNAHIKEIDSDNAYIKQLDPKNTNGLDGVSDAAIVFAQNSMGTFLTCSADETNCNDLRAQSLVTSEGDKAIKSALGNTMDLEFIPALIAGIGILVWIVVLCVDVIVRRFKLLLLQMIAPIPIISYVDPNDQMFNKWGKMYISTYLDLFLKLIAISFAISLLEIVWVIRPNSAIETFFYVVAILVFAKMIPSMISDIFGIKLGSGTFKDITGMGKAALGFGAGALLGGAIGAATGAQAGNGIFGKIGSGALGGVKGAALGAGSGSKGNVTGGAKSIAATNALKAQGLNWFDRLRYQGLGALGIDPNISERQALAQLEQAKTQVENVQSLAGAVDKSIEATPQVAAFMGQLGPNGSIKDITGNKAKAIKEAYATAYDNYNIKTGTGPSSLSLSDIKKTKAYHDMTSAEQRDFDADFNKLYGENAVLKVDQKAWGENYRTNKSAWVTGMGILRSDKETVAFLQNPNIGKDQEKVSDLLTTTIGMDTKYNDIVGSLKTPTFGLQREINNELAREKESIRQKDANNPNKK